MTNHNFTNHLTDTGIKLKLPEGFGENFYPTEACFDWCIEQQVVHSNNLELWVMFFPAIAFLMITLYFWSFELDKLEKYRSAFIYMARLFLIMFFAAYILIIRLRIYY